MFSVNHVVLVGRVSDEVKMFNGNVSFATFRMGIYGGKNKDGKAIYNNATVKCFKGLADDVYENIKKGSDVIVTGTFTSGSYKNKKGETVYTTDVVANNVGIALGGNE